MKIKEGQLSKWNNYVAEHQTGYDRTIIMFTETIANLIELNRDRFWSFNISLISAIREAVVLCGIKTDDPELADAMVNEAFGLLFNYWESGWIMEEYSFRDKTLYHEFRITWTLR
ncbi:MAG TPA: hypothetical protein P5056_00920 [Candidatus Paceibacterota bacterium]|nr:hypothetical protein [Candidatus Paceibacterota bacterium]